MDTETLERFHKLIKFPYGMILVTGPTGSGKSTTLYASLNAINSVEKNIVTIEDPVEYELDLVRQTQVNPKVGLTFATGLRAILRQDPDIIMVGEIRDMETAEIAAQSALTGHLVFSTLHTNTACGAITRLTDMGIQPFLIASSVVGVLAQRLVRKICDHCRHEIKVPPALLQEFGIPIHTPFYEGKGCDRCQQMKYHGRTTIHELAVISDEIREMIISRTSEEEIFKIARKQGMKTLRESGIEKAKQGITSLDEVIKVTAGDADA
jgi:type II secretory ATPase GspE/PulE/Tfp pilus assembly ATPase PilB-like protein